MELEKLVTIWQSLVEKRKQLKEQAEKIEKVETQFEEAISGLLASRGMLGAKLPIGTVARKVIFPPACQMLTLSFVCSIQK